jgi:hypothetical protein
MITEEAATHIMNKLTTRLDATTDPYIEIRFEIDPADVPSIYSKVAMHLRDTIRHEIEHITQTGWNLLPGKVSFQVIKQFEEKRLN